MSSRSRLVPLPFLLLGALLAPTTGCAQAVGASAAANAGDAAKVVRGLVRDMRRNDLAAFWKDGLPPAAYAAAEQTWESRQHQPVSNKEREGFRQLIQRLTAPRAETTLARQWEPVLTRLDRQYSDQLPVLIAIGGGMFRQMTASLFALNPAQVQGLEPLLAPWIAWAQQAPWLDLARSRRLAGIAVETARALRLTSLTEVRDLDFPAAMRKASILLAGGKRALAQYGLSLDEVLDSVTVRRLSRQGDTAWIRIEYRLRGQPQQAVLKMHRLDGHWYPMALPQLANGLYPPDGSWWGPERPAQVGFVGAAGDPGQVPVQ